MRSSDSLHVGKKIKLLNAYYHGYEHGSSVFIYFSQLVSFSFETGVLREDIKQSGAWC